MGTKAVGVLKRLLVPSYTDWLFVALIGWLFASGDGWNILLMDGDTGWHIRAGEYILDMHLVPRADLFSFSKPWAPWFAWEWLSDVFYALIWRRAGLRGIVVMAGILIAAYLAILFRRMLWRGGNLLFALIICLLATGASRIHYLARPHLFTLLLLAIALWMLDRDRREHDFWIWLLIPLSTLWTNLHGGFFALIVSVAVLAGAALLERNWNEAGRYSLLTAGCAMATLVNPYGWELHRHLFEYLRSDWIRDAIDEFQSPKFRTENAVHFEILLFMGLAAAALLVRRKRFGDAGLIILWAHAALVSVRHVPLYALVAGPVIVSEATRYWDEWTARQSKRSIPSILNSLSRDLADGARRASLLPAVAVLILALGVIPLRWPQDFPGIKFPVRMVERYGERLSHSRVFSSDQWSDYLIYRFPPHRVVFMDGRSDFYGPEIGKLYLKVIGGHTEWRKTFANYGIDLVLAEKSWPLTSLLRQSSGWQVLDEDDRAVLFERTVEVQADDELKESTQPAELWARSR